MAHSAVSADARTSSSNATFEPTSPRTIRKRQANFQRRGSLRNSLVDVIAGKGLDEASPPPPPPPPRSRQELWEIMKTLLKRFLMCWRIVKAFSVGNNDNLLTMGSFFAGYGERSQLQASDSSSGAAAGSSPRGSGFGDSDSDSDFESADGSDGSRQESGYGVDDDGGLPSPEHAQQAKRLAKSGIFMVHGNSRNRVRGHLSKRLSLVSLGSDALEMAEIGNLRAEKRTEAQIRRLAAILPTIAYFENQLHEVNLEIARVVEFRTVPKNHVLVHKGDTGNWFYVILHGTVAVMVNAAGTKFCACELGEGETFADFALLKQTDRRAASIVATRFCRFLAIDRGNYERIMKQVVHLQVEELESFFRKLVYFKNWSPDRLRELCDCTVVKTYKRNAVIAKQGTPNSAIYIVKRGTCRILKRVKVPRGSPAASPRPRTCMLELCHLHANDFFGEEALFAAPSSAQRVRHRCSLVAGSNAQVLHISPSLIRRSLDAESMAVLKEFNDQKQAFLTSDDHLLNLLQKERRWSKFKGNFVGHVIDSKHREKAKERAGDSPLSRAQLTLQ